MNQKDKIKEQGLLRLEAKMANALLLDGLDSLKKASLLNEGFYYQSFFSLSTGIERLLKLTIIYQYKKENEEKLPENKTLRKLKHEIKKMVELYVPELLEKNMYGVIIEFIDEYARRTRYYNLDTLTGKENEVDPFKVWSIIEGYILKNYNAQIPNIEEETKIANELNQSIGIEWKLSDGTEIKDMGPIVHEYIIKDTIQEYNVLIFYEIIKILVNKLIESQGNNTYPDMEEIFSNFRIEIKEEEIRKKQDWRKEIR